MNLRLFDLHCDTLYECNKQNKSLVSNDLNLSLKRLSEYERFCQVLAMWSDPKDSEDENYRNFFMARELLARQLSEAEKLGISVRLCQDSHTLTEADSSGSMAVMLAVEGGRLLSGDLSRLDSLYEAGVRFLTLVWNKTCKIGGAHDSDEGLTDFGREVVLRCFELGIIPDVSHASVKMTSEVLEMCEASGKVCVATHSNSHTVCAHRRNLDDASFKRIAKLGGIVGVSLAPMHLTNGDKCTIDDIAAHIEHYLSLGGEDTVCLGCDLDGVGHLPEGIENVSDLYKIAEKLAQNNYNEILIDKIFYANARNFISLWLN